MSINYDEIEGLVEAHMQDQPYSCNCDVCGAGLEFDGEIDGMQDLILTVSPCQSCLQEAKNGMEG